MLPGNYAPRPSGYGNWVGTQAARAVAAYVLDNGHHLIAPYLGTTQTARNIPPISYMDTIRAPGGPTHTRKGVSKDMFGKEKGNPDGPWQIPGHRKYGLKRRKLKFKRTPNARQTRGKRTYRKRSKTC